MPENARKRSQSIRDIWRRSCVAQSLHHLAETLRRRRRAIEGRLRLSRPSSAAQTRKSVTIKESNRARMVPASHSAGVRKHAKKQGDAWNDNSEMAASDVALFDRFDSKRGLLLFRNLLRILGASARKSLLHPNRNSRDSSWSSVGPRGARGGYRSHHSRHIRSRRSLGRTDCPDPSFRVRSRHCRATRAVACRRSTKYVLDSQKVRLPAEEN